MKKIKRIILLLVVVAICICGYEVKLGYDKYTDANDKKDETLLAETEEQNEQTVMEKTDNKESEVFSIDTVKKMNLKECFLDGDMGIVHTDMTLRSTPL